MLRIGQALFLLVVACTPFRVSNDPPLACAPTAAQSEDGRLSISGDLGARMDPLVAGSDVKVLWLRSNASAGESLRIQGRRLDGPERLELTLPAASTTVPWPAGGLAHGYPSSFVVPSVGCWRFSLLDGKPGDTLTFRVD